MRADLNSDGIVGPFYGSEIETIAQAGEGLVAYFHFRAKNDQGISYLLDPTTQEFLQDRFALSKRDLQKGADLNQVKAALMLRVIEGLPSLKTTIQAMQNGILFDFDFTDVEILPTTRDMLPLAARKQYKGYHSHQHGMGPDAEPHDHDTRVNFEFIGPDRLPIDFSLDEESVNFIDKKLKAFFDHKYLNTSGEEIVQKLYALGEGFRSDPDAPTVLREAKINAAEMTLDYQGDMDHPHVPMTFRVSNRFISHSPS